MPNSDFLGKFLANSGTSTNFRTFGLRTGLSNDLFYNPPPRTGDLINQVNLGNINFGSVFQNDFHIAPSKTAFDVLANKGLDQISAALSTIPLDNLPVQNDILAKSLGEILEEFASDNPAFGLKRKLQEDKKTGILIQVAKKLNASKLDAITRNVLSRENLFIYTAYRAIVGLGVTDMEGIISAITDSISKVKAELNRRLAREVIQQNNLQASEKLIASIQDELAGIELSYAPGAVKSQVLEVYEKFKNSGGILGLINEFLDGDFVKIPENMTREGIIRKMLEFLIEVGFVTEDEVIDDDPLPIQIPRDNFDTAIKGIGPSTQKSLYDAGIFTYGQLASTNLEKLKSILPTSFPNNTILNVIEQAKLAQEGRFQELLDLQDGRSPADGSGDEEASQDWAE